jgi:hypothetical protein
MDNRGAAIRQLVDQQRGITDAFLGVVGPFLPSVICLSVSRYIITGGRTWNCN